jgi:hypothetical protein
MLALLALLLVGAAPPAKPGPVEEARARRALEAQCLEKRFAEERLAAYRLVRNATPPRYVDAAEKVHTLLAVLRADRSLTVARRNQLIDTLNFDLTNLKKITAERRGEERFTGSIRPILDGVRKAKTLVVFEGAPHQRWEAELLARELREKKTVRLHDFPFYAESLELKEADALEVWALCPTKQVFRGRSGMKLCGGFHPDWCLEWRDGDKAYRALLCFGCHEARLYGPKDEVECDLDEATLKQLRRILVPYRKNRPGPDERGTWKKLPRIDLDRELKLVVEKKAAAAGIELSDWRWLAGGRPACLLKPSRHLPAGTLAWTAHDEEGRTFGGGRLPEQEVVAGEKALLYFSDFDFPERPARIVIRLAPTAPDRAPTRNRPGHAPLLRGDGPERFLAEDGLEAEDESRKKLPKVDLDKELTIDIDRAVVEAGVELGDWRWGERGELSVVLRPTRRPLPRGGLSWATYDRKGRLSGTGELPPREALTNQSRPVSIPNRDAPDRPSRVEVWFSPSAKAPRPE